MALPLRHFIPAVKIVSIPGITMSNLDGNGLRMEWNVRRDNTNKPDTGTVSIFNLAPSVASTIYESWQVVKQGLQLGVSLSLLVGWDRVPKLIFRGDIVKFTPNRRTPTDVITTWEIGDAMERLRDTMAAVDLHGVNLANAMEYLVSLPPNRQDAGGGGLGLLYPPESKALIVQAASELAGRLPDFSNLPKSINVRQMVDVIMETLGLQWRVHNGAFIAMRGGIIIGRQVPQISPASGLIEFEVTDDGGITFTALSDDRFEPGAQCIVLDKLNKPVGLPAYRIESVTFAGSTDDQSLMTVVGRKPLFLT